MTYQVNSDSWTKITETSGTIQNLDGLYTVELTNDTLSGGIWLGVKQKITFSNTDIYLRCIGDDATASVVVVPFIVDGKGSGSDGSIVIDGDEYHISDSNSFEDRLDEYFPD